MTEAPTGSHPSKSPTSDPTSAPTPFPSTEAPTGSHPSKSPTSDPTSAPTPFPSTEAPTGSHPSKSPTSDPTSAPTPFSSTEAPTGSHPSKSPTSDPTSAPTPFPSTEAPTGSHPTKSRTSEPTSVPTPFPSTEAPTGSHPTKFPTSEPTSAPTPFPSTEAPTGSPTQTPLSQPTDEPQELPAPIVTVTPSTAPTETTKATPAPVETAQPIATTPAVEKITNTSTTETLTKAEQCRAQYTESQCVAHGYRNRKLQRIATEDLLVHHTACLTKSYQMFLVVEGVHFAGLVVAADSDNNTGCPSIVLHSQGGNPGAPVEKVAMIAAPEEVETFEESSKHFLGEQPLGTIMEAFASSEAGRNGAKFYDSITNNCVALLRNMADPLEIPIDDGMIDFVTKKLLDASDTHLWDGIQKSPALSLLVKGGQRMLKGINKEAVLRKLVEMYI